MLELYCNFFTKFCDVTKFGELEKDTDSLYLALAEKDPEVFIKTETRADWWRWQSNDCVAIFTADAVANLFLRTSCIKQEQHDKREPVLFREEFRCTEMLCLCGKTNCCYDVTSHKPKLSSECLNKRVLGQSGDGPLEKYRRVLNEKVNVTLNNGGFRRNSHFVATYEQVKKILSYFYTEQIVQPDGIHTQTLTL